MNFFPPQGDAQSSSTRSWITLSEDTTLDPGIHEDVNVDTSGGARVITLPDAPAGNPKFVIKRDGANKVTIDTEAAELIDGASSKELANDNDVLRVRYDNDATEYHII